MTGSIAKPLDLGTGAVCASFDPETAAWLSLGRPHPKHGFVELAAVPPFDEADRGDPAATRRHRAGLADPRAAFLAVQGHAPLQPDWSDPRHPAWVGPGCSVTADAAVDATTIVQRWTVDREVRIALRGTLDRPALAEITEIDPPVLTGATTRLAPAGAVARVDAPALPAHASIEVPGGTWRESPGGAELVVGPGSFEVRATLGEAAAGRASDDAGIDPDPLVARALAYVRGCTALRTGPDERVILTDHRLLPLSWTRDAYYQALLLLAADGPGDRERVADHLRWLWRRCERPDGRWVRSHHANGRRKDLSFQADQQLYPIVELADYWRRAGSLPDGVDWTDAVAGAWEAAMTAVDPASGLIASSETAADDPAEAPFIAAAQLLLWYTARRVTELDAAGALRAPWVHGVADAVRAAFDGHLVHEGRWAYAAGPGGERVAYHDANDLPIALAPWWGFCSADDGAWRATIAFAFSNANPGHVAGPSGGLGSVHTPGAWPLGMVQAWIVARAIGDAAGAARALDRLRRSAFPDGMLPEALPDGQPVRHWFAWPGAVIGALLLLERAGDAGRLAAGPGG